MTVKEMKFATKPWISNSIKKSIFRRSRLHKLSRIPHPNQAARKNKFNRYKKRLEKVLSAAEQKYYSDKIQACQNQTKAIWKIINQITKRKKTSKNSINKLKIDGGKFLENSKDIANYFNNFFVNIGPQLAEKLPLSEKSFYSYLGNSPTESFMIDPTNSVEVLKVIESYTDSICEDPVKITPKIVKLGAKSLAKSLSYLINKSFFTRLLSLTLKNCKSDTYIQGWG